MKSLLATLALSVSLSWAGDVTVHVRHGQLVGNGFPITVPGLEELSFILTVSHVVDDGKYAIDSVKVDGFKDASVVAVCKDYDLLLLSVPSIPAGMTKVVLPKQGLNLDNEPLTLCVTKPPKSFRARLLGPATDGSWQWEIKSHYELGFSGGALLIGNTNRLAAVANGAWVKDKVGGKITIVPEHGLVIPVPIVRKFLAVSKDRILDNSSNGDVIVIDRKAVDGYGVKHLPVIEDSPNPEPVELKAKPILLDDIRKIEDELMRNRARSSLDLPAIS